MPVIMPRLREQLCAILELRSHTHRSHRAPSSPPLKDHKNPASKTADRDNPAPKRARHANTAEHSKDDADHHYNKSADKAIGSTASINIALHLGFTPFNRL